MADIAPDSLLDRSAVRLAASATDKEDAVRQCGQALVDCGCVDESYIRGMLERESTISTYVGGLSTNSGSATIAPLMTRRADGECRVRAIGHLPDSAKHKRSRATRVRSNGPRRMP